MAIPSFFDNEKSLLIVDGTSLLFRNFSISKNVFVNKYGQDVGSLQGTITSLNALCNEYKPHHMVVVFDPKGGSFRNEMYADYKANRTEANTQLINQIEITQEIVKAMGYNTLIIPGYEADDIIGTIARYNSERGVSVTIESGDKDFIQLVNPLVTLSSRNKTHSIYDVEHAPSRFGVPIEYTIDYLAIVGDSVDNIPGIKGLGPKKAEALINTFGGLKDIYHHLDTVGFSETFAGTRPERLTKLLNDNREIAFLSYQLATIKTDVELENIDVSDFNFNYPDVARVVELTEAIDAFGSRDSFLSNKFFINNLFIEQGYPDAQNRNLAQDIESYLSSRDALKKYYRLQRVEISKALIERIDYMKLFNEGAFKGQEDPLAHLLNRAPISSEDSFSSEQSVSKTSKSSKKVERSAKEENIFNRRNSLIDCHGKTTEELSLFKVSDFSSADLTTDFLAALGDLEAVNNSFAAQASWERFLLSTQDFSASSEDREEKLKQPQHFGYNKISRLAANFKASDRQQFLTSLVTGQHPAVEHHPELVAQAQQALELLARSATEEESASATLSPAVLLQTLKAVLEGTNYREIIADFQALDITYYRHPQTNKPLYLSFLFSLGLKRNSRTAKGILSNGTSVVSKLCQFNFDLEAIASKLSASAFECFKVALQELLLKPLLIRGKVAPLYPGVEAQELEAFIPNLPHAVGCNALKDLCHDFYFSQEEVALIETQLVSDVCLLAYHYYGAVKETSLGGYFNHYLSAEALKPFLATLGYSGPELEEAPTSLKEFRLGKDFAPYKVALGALALMTGELRRRLASYHLDKGNLLNQLTWKYLFNMEDNGVYINPYKLKLLEKEITAKQEAVLRKLITEYGAPEDFNPNSPLQVGRYLFDQLALVDQSAKRSTSAEAIKGLHHPAADLIIDYRSLNTILSTHITGLIKEVETRPFGVVQTTYLQTSTITGRLSSIAPNLQNVPASGEFSDLIHQCFQAPQGYKYLSLDYSQIELRVLAYFSLDHNMLEAFNQGLDIHRQTASRLFNIELAAVNKEQRQIAKAINFGLNYGKSAFSLAKELEISQQKASEYMKMYFSTYPQIKTAGDSFKNNAIRREYCDTVLGTKIPLTNIHSSITTLVKSDHRNALNYPIQGSAAQIIKKAMNELYKVLAKEAAHLDIRPVLQVHDELVFQVKESDLEAAVTLIKGIMEEGVKELVEEKVKLKVDYGFADYWSK